MLKFYGWDLFRTLTRPYKETCRYSAFKRIGGYGAVAEPLHHTLHPSG